MMQWFRNFVHLHTKRIIDEAEMRIKYVPREVMWMTLFLSYNVLLQGIADVFLKIFGLFPWFPMVDLRVDFLTLTAVSVLMGYQALRGLRRRELDVTRNSVALGILVEAGLVIGDLHYLSEVQNVSHTIIRSPFLIFTTINIFILLHIAQKLKLFRDEEGRFVLS